MTTTINARGIKIRSRSQRRFVAVAVRPEDITITADSDAHRIFGRAVGTYVAFAEIIGRSDSLDTARRRARNSSSYGVGVARIVIDTATGEEV